MCIIEKPSESHIFGSNVYVNVFFFAYIVGATPLANEDNCDLFDNYTPCVVIDQTHKKANSRRFISVKAYTLTLYVGHSVMTPEHLYRRALKTQHLNSSFNLCRKKECKASNLIVHVC